MGVVVADLDDEVAQRVGDRISDKAVVGRCTPTCSAPKAWTLCCSAPRSWAVRTSWSTRAGGWGGAGRQFPDATFDQWRRVLELNLVAPMAPTQRCVPLMMRLGGGVDVNIASSAGLGHDGYGLPEYPAAKAGLIRFTSSLANLTDSHRVRVNCVVPDWIVLPRAHSELEFLHLFQLVLLVRR